MCVCVCRLNIRVRSLLSVDFMFLDDVQIANIIVSFKHDESPPAETGLQVKKTLSQLTPQSCFFIVG